ncbi:MAG: ATPase [Betaproteobacteria bacterium]|nr:ATPase [Betaproteobacteria bacterium]
MSGPPFQLSPDPTFYFESRGHQRALAYLQYGIVQGEGFIVVSGEIGTGKTTLVKKLLSALDETRVVAGEVLNTQLNCGELLQAVGMAFGVPLAGQSKAQMLGSLEAHFLGVAASGRRALLVVDEAQNLDNEALEELRMLSNFQLGPQALLQSFLVGQPGLRQKLASPSLEQLRQRIMAACHLEPLAAEETQGYLSSRLSRVGWSGRPRFDDEAVNLIHNRCDGVPRRINRLCTRLLLAACLDGRDDIDADFVARTADELTQEVGTFAMA